MKNKRRCKETNSANDSPQHKPKLRIIQEIYKSPVVSKCPQTPPTQCNAQELEASDDSCPYNVESPKSDVVWNWKLSPISSKVRNESKEKYKELSKRLVKEMYERNKKEEPDRTVVNKEKTEPKISALEKFKSDIQRLNSQDDDKATPKKSTTFRKKKENVTKSFTFGLSDDEDDTFFKFRWNGLNQNESNDSEDVNWRRTKSAHDFETKPIIEAPQKDLFDDSVSNQILFGANSKSMDVNGNNDKKSQPTVQFEDSFDEVLSEFPLEELVKRTQDSSNPRSSPKTISKSQNKSERIPTTPQASSTNLKSSKTNKLMNNGLLPHNIATSSPKLVRNLKKSVTTPEFEDSFDEIMSTFPLEEVEQTAQKSNCNTNKPSIQRFNSMPQTFSDDSKKYFAKTNSMPTTSQNSCTSVYFNLFDNENSSRQQCTEEEIKKKRQHAIELRAAKTNKRLKPS